MRRLLTFLAFALLLPFGSAQAQGLDIGMVQGRDGALPITIVPMPYLGTSVAPDTDIAAVIRADLNRSGQFNALSEQDVIEKPIRGSEIKFPTWRVLKQDFIVVGRVLDNADGGYRVEYELYDVAKQERMLGLAVGGRARGMRDVAHQIADQVYEKILGVRGAFWTRIAYVTANGLGGNTQYALMVADSDGFNPQTVVKSREPLLSPAWSPDGRKLAYVSFERGNSTIYVQEITTGAREVLASFKGINGAPSFSPDGRRLALTLSRTGNPEIYVMDLATKQVTQVTRHYGIDTEAVWSADGQSLVFTSDRAGKPQLYQVPASGGDATRVSFQGDSNAKASISFDGKKIAMAQGSGNVYRIAVLDRSFGGAGRWQTLSPGNLDESPSFAPNASMLLYATKEGRRGVLFAVSADGSVRQRLVLADGDVREPAWSPFRQR
ncbi:Tol-Pal system beta propeller repeat protein TolB [Arenimonas sp.]|uniref:Tol-Pal system beta propeller repeat protein TolB n=1 Tax=Arenimonas sp. TaxID=1872635 RepID=UPI002E30B062|nr:Tol-Pal system beta propeller repeat protein TolB [Arenimonas sp.]HEX4854849.1 Tol-Pal system beta propeller repeat protein TolB [Arenimonas sp.]